MIKGTSAATYSYNISTSSLQSSYQSSAEPTLPDALISIKTLQKLCLAFLRGQQNSSMKDSKKNMVFEKR